MKSVSWERESFRKWTNEGEPSPLSLVLDYMSHKFLPRPNHISNEFIHNCKPLRVAMGGLLDDRNGVVHYYYHMEPFTETTNTIITQLHKFLLLALSVPQPPKKLRLTFDGHSTNRSGAMLAYLYLLVQWQVFSKVQVIYSVRNHGHNRLDGLHHGAANALSKELVCENDIFHQLLTCKNTQPHHLYTIYNWTEWFQKFHFVKYSGLKHVHYVKITNIGIQTKRNLKEEAYSSWREECTLEEIEPFNPFPHGIPNGNPEPFNRPPFSGERMNQLEKLILYLHKHQNSSFQKATEEKVNQLKMLIQPKVIPVEEFQHLTNTSREIPVVQFVDIPKSQEKTTKKKKRACADVGEVVDTVQTKVSDCSTGNNSNLESIEDTSHIEQTPIATRTRHLMPQVPTLIECRKTFSDGVYCNVISDGKPNTWVSEKQLAEELKTISNAQVSKSASDVEKNTKKTPNQTQYRRQDCKDKKGRKKTPKKSNK